MDKKEKVKSLINSLNIKLPWLADRLEMKTQVLNFLLNDEADLDENLYKKIIEVIDSYQYELKFYSADTYSELTLFDADRLHLGIGDRIKVFARKKYGNMKKMADALGISPQQLHQYTSGKREPGSKVLIRFLRLGCDLNWLLGGAESIESYKIYKLENEIRNLRQGMSDISELLSRLNHDN